MTKKQREWKAYYKKNKKKLRKASRKAYRTNRMRILEKARLARYGVSKEQYRGMVAEQNNMCKICKCPMKSPHIDHNHTTGVVRGLLCVKCNFGIGYFNEDVAVMRSAIEYITINGKET